MMSFFGITKDSAGKYQKGPGERIPPSWFARKTPYDVLSLVDETSAMYNLNVSISLQDDGPSDR